MKVSVKLVLLMLLTIAAVSCKETDMYDPEFGKNDPTTTPKVPNTFNYSTVQDVALTVDYSSYETYGPVFFSVYSQNPFVGEGEEEQLDESIQPIFEDYTNANGRFSMTIQLPAYAKHLYVVTGNFFVWERLIEANVQNGAATAVATNNTFASARHRSLARRGAASTQQVMDNLYYIVNDKGEATGDPIYNKWETPLGSWDAESGRPNYLIKPGDVDDELMISSAEMKGLYSAIGQALNTNGCSMTYRNQPDITLLKQSQVTVTMLGGNTCWNSSLGYYYYMEGHEPRSLKDLHVIMLFPNTQDGQWSKVIDGNYGYSFNKNVGVSRGDAVLLKYYPNIASGDLTTCSTEFPAGIRIGFILKAHGWGMQGDSYGVEGFKDSNRKYNVWGATTSGLSYCKVPAGYENKKAPYQYPNHNGESRSARFSYTSSEGNQYAIVSFEDACNDQDFDDVIFALKPVNSFSPLPGMDQKKSYTKGVYAFEDLWPKQGDFDLNDVVVDFKHEKVMTKSSNETEYKISQESFYLTTYQNYVTLKTGLALTLNTKVKPSSIVLKKIERGKTTQKNANFTVIGDVYYLTDDVKNEIGSTYIIELNYKNGITSDKLASVQPFIYRNEGDSDWEVHIPYEEPTSRMKKSYFGQDDDASVLSTGPYYVRAGNFPFAFFLSGADINTFKDTILKRENESKPISDFYSNYMDWVTSSGADDADWYNQ